MRTLCAMNQTVYRYPGGARGTGGSVEIIDSTDESWAVQVYMSLLPVQPQGDIDALRTQMSLVVSVTGSGTTPVMASITTQANWIMFEVVQGDPGAISIRTMNLITPPLGANIQS